MSYSEKGLLKMPKMDYKTVRGNLKSGDLFFASGNYFVSKLIEDATDSMWSHVGVIFRVEEIDRVLLLESVEDAGVRFAPLSKYLDDYEDDEAYDGKIYIARYEQDIPEEDIKKMAVAGCDRLARPYDKDETSSALPRGTFCVNFLIISSRVIPSREARLITSRCKSKTTSGYSAPRNSLNNLAISRSLRLLTSTSQPAGLDIDGSGDLGCLKI